MRCRQFRKKYRKYLCGNLSESEYNRIIKHIPDCPDCAAEAVSLQKMRSLLQTAGKADRPDEYWNTYWDRLEKKLPAEPLQFTLWSRISSAVKELFHRPVLLGQIAVYILLLAFIIYTVPNRLFRETSKQQIPTGIAAQSSAKLNETQSKPESAIAAGRKLSTKIDQNLVRKAPESPVKHSLAREEPKMGIGASRPLPGAKPPGPEEKSAVTGLAIKEAEPARPVIEAMYDKLELSAEAADQYVIAEQHFKDGEYALAIPAYQNFVTANSTDPRAVNAQYQIGESYYQMKKYPEAISNFAIITDAEKKEGEVAKEVKSQKEEAGDAIAPPRDEERQFGYRARRSEATEKEAPVLEQITDDRKDTKEDREKLMARAIYRQAESYENLKKTEEALEKYREYVQKYPEGEYTAQAKEKIDNLSK